jgi:hypothetical protein
MNIFILDYDKTKCVQSYVDKHIVKMCLESTQLLSSAYYSTNQESLAPYKKTHMNHPCSIWVRESKQNWEWLKDLALKMCKEYSFRYGKKHKCEEIIRDMVVPNLPDKCITEFKCCMDKKYIISSDPIENYRNYYNNSKRELFKWTKREQPLWARM